MSPDLDFEEKERERRIRRRVFHLIFASLALILGGFLIWKLSSLVLPIIVGALLAFLFRPVKERFKIPWLPHELQVLCSFAAIGPVLRLRHCAQTYSRRPTEARIQGTPEIQIEREVPTTRDEIAGGKIEHAGRAD